MNTKIRRERKRSIQAGDREEEDSRDLLVHLCTLKRRFYQPSFSFFFSLPATRPTTRFITYIFVLLDDFPYQTVEPLFYIYFKLGEYVCKTDTG